MRRSIEKQIFAGVAAVSTVLSFATVAAVFRVWSIGEVRLPVSLALGACLVFSLLTGFVWWASFRGRREAHESTGGTGIAAQPGGKTDDGDFFDETSIACHELDAEGRVLRVNKAELAMLGYSLEEMVGRPIDEFVVETDAEGKSSNTLARGGESSHAIQRSYRRKDGRLIPVLAGEALIRDSDGNVRCTRSAIQDLGEIMRREDSLRAVADNYRNIVENATEGVFQFQRDKGYLNANPALASILGYCSSGELLNEVTDLGRQVYVDADRYGAFCSQLETQSSVSEFECRVRRKDGTVIWVSQNGRVVRDSEGRVLRYEGSMENIEARRSAESAMAAARDAAIESARLKAEFLANMSHEIRTPMNGIIGMTGLLLDTGLNPRQREFAETISESTEALLKIINDILDYSKIEADMVTFEEVQFELNDVLEGVVDLFSGRALSKNVELSLVISRDVPEFVVGDPGRLRQVLANLVGNAFKFTDKGEVRLSVRVSEDLGEETRLLFEVTDTGIGISADQQARLFQAFVQADGSTTRRFGGTGLGLAISKRIVSQMNGAIGLESEPGQGSRFFFTALFRKAPVEEDPRSQQFDGMRALIVDDSEATRAAIARALETWGVSFVETASATEALNLLCEASREGNAYDIAFIDANLPRVGGENITMSIRANPDYSKLKLVKIVLLNCQDNPDDPDDNAFDGQLARPIKQKSVDRCLEAAIMAEQGQSLGAVSPRGAQPIPPIPRPRRALHVLVAEDNAVNQKVVQCQLQELGCAVTPVGNGEEVLSAARENAFDVILMDCEMPELDGYESTRRIRQSEAGGTRRTWIIAMTANSLAGDRDRCLEAGMDDYLSKPLRLRELAEALGRCPIQGLPLRPREEAGWESAVSQETLASFRELEEESGQNFLERVIDLFIESTPPAFQEARLAVGRQDAQRLARLAHTLKGSCSNFGANRMRSACERLEAIAQNGVLDAAEEALDRVEREFGFVRTALENELPAKAS